jgi:hypothetical protein
MTSRDADDNAAAGRQQASRRRAVVAFGGSAVAVTYWAAEFQTGGGACSGCDSFTAALAAVALAVVGADVMHAPLSC